MFDPGSEFEEYITQNRDDSKKDLKTMLFSICQNVSVGIFIFALLTFLTVLPLVFDFGDVKWYAKILMIFGSFCAFIFLNIILMFLNEETKSDKWLLYFSPLLITYVVGIAAYFNFELWGQKSFIVGLVFVWIIFVGLYVSIKALFNKALGKENAPIILIAISILTLLVAMVNEKANNDAPANLYYKITFGIIYLILTALYVNKYIYKLKNQQRIISNIIGIIFWGALITISFPFYIQWCGLKGDNFQTFVSVYSAVLGGGITLAGVAWTIKDSNIKRAEDLQRIETERKEEERKKYTPYIGIAIDTDVSNYICVTKVKWLNINKPEDIAKIKDNSFCAIKINNFLVKNISNSNIIFEGIYIDDDYYKFNYEMLLEENGVICIKFPTDMWYEFPEKISYIGLRIADILGNHYKTICKHSYKLCGRPEKEVSNDGIVYKKHAYEYSIESVLLPVLLNEDDD